MIATVPAAVPAAAGAAGVVAQLPGGERHLGPDALATALDRPAGTYLLRATGTSAEPVAAALPGAAAGASRSGPAVARRGADRRRHAGGSLMTRGRVTPRARVLRDRSGDPLDGLVNLFDLGVVLAVAFLPAALSSLKLTDLLTRSDVTVVRSKPASRP